MDAQESAVTTKTKGRVRRAVPFRTLRGMTRNAAYFRLRHGTVKSLCAARKASALFCALAATAAS